jgi:ketosteroid isomerase-like protein
MAKIESAMRVVLTFNEAFNRHDVAGMMALMSDDCIFENTAPVPGGAVFSGKDDVTRCWEGFFHESSQVHFAIEEIFGLGNRCIMPWKYSWVDATGKRGMCAESISSR